MTTFTSPHDLPIIEPTIDKIKDSAEPSALAGDINALSQAVNAAITLAMSEAQTNASYIKPAVGSTTLLHSLTEPGAYPIRFATNTDGVGYSGTLFVGDTENGTLKQTTHLFIAADGGGVFYESARNGVWTNWQNLTGNFPVHKPVAISVDIQTLTVPGIYPLPYSTNPNGVGSSGTLYVNNASHPSISFVSQMHVSADGTGVKWQSARDGNWTGWSEVGTPAGSADEGATRREVLLSEARRRRGGTIGTAGRGVASLRFDHHWVPFKQYVLPLLKKYGFAWSLPMNSASPFADDKVSGSIPWSTIQADAINNGGEVTNHGRSHGDAGTLPAMRREIIQAKAELEGFLPELAIETWNQPGVGGTQLGGTEMTSVDSIVTTAGRLILANHAFVSGGIGSHYRPLGGEPAIGHSHYTMDSATLNHWRTAIDTAIATSTGIQFMLHPSAIVGGTTTVATLDAAFAYMAAKRDAGELVILSPSASLLADAGSTVRRNLLRKNSLTAGETVVLPLTSAGGGYPVDFRGAIHELVVDGAATLTVTSDTGGLNASVSNPVEGTETRLVFNVPLSATNITVTSSRAVATATLRAS